MVPVVGLCVRGAIGGLRRYCLGRWIARMCSWGVGRRLRRPRRGQTRGGRRRSQRCIVRDRVSSGRRLDDAVQLAFYTVEPFASFPIQQGALTRLCTKYGATGPHAMKTEESHVCLPCRRTGWALVGPCKVGKMLLRPSCHVVRLSTSREEVV